MTGIERTEGDAPRYAMTIGGAAVASAEADAVRNPADGSLVGYAARATRADVNAAVEAAARAFQTWRHTPDAERAAACTRIAATLQANAAELARLITLEQGKPIKAGGFGSEFELGGCVAWSGATAMMSLKDQVIEENERGRVVRSHTPLGVVASITPWNWPLMIAVWHILPAIRSGNTVVIKPSPFTPLSTLRAVGLLNAVLPPGVLNVVTGGAEIGEALTTHRAVRKIVFTGSTATGKKIMEKAAADVKRVTLEMGGNDAAIILPGADPARIAGKLFGGAFINAGQTCGAIKRLYVHEGEYDAFCAALANIARATPMGDGRDDANVLGPLQNEMQFEKVKALVDEAVQQGAKPLAGGKPLGMGYFYAATILANCSDDMRIVKDEQFGPALPVLKYSAIDEAVRRANATDYGLTASVWGPDEQLARGVADQLEAGTVYINSHAELHPFAPFGGVKSSGLGVEFGEEGLAAYTDAKVTFQRAY